MCVLCVSMHVCACVCVYGMHVCICILCLHVHVCLSVMYCVSQSITFTALVKRETTLMRREIDSVSTALVAPDCVVLFGQHWSRACVVLMGCHWSLSLGVHFA